MTQLAGYLDRMLFCRGRIQESLGLLPHVAAQIVLALGTVDRLDCHHQSSHPAARPHFFGNHYRDRQKEFGGLHRV